MNLFERCLPALYAAVPLLLLLQRTRQVLLFLAHLGFTTLHMLFFLPAMATQLRLIQEWITEYGTPTNSPGAEATPSNYNFALHPDHVNEALQAQMANDSVRMARSSSYIGALYW